MASRREVKFQSLSEGEKLELLKALGYDVDEEGFIVNPDGSLHKGKYTGEEVLFENAFIMPGSTVIDTASSVTLSKYIGEYIETDNE